MQDVKKLKDRNVNNLRVIKEYNHTLIKKIKHMRDINFFKLMRQENVENRVLEFKRK